MSVHAGHVAELIAGEGSRETEAQKARVVGSSLVVSIEQLVGGWRLEVGGGRCDRRFGGEEWWRAVVSGFYCQEYLIY